MPEIDVVLPSGLSAMMRRMKVREQNVLADLRNTRNSQPLMKVLEACFGKILDRGPYEAESKIDWTRVLIGDHFSAVLQLLSVTYPGAYQFSVQCGNEQCNATIHWEIEPLQLPVKKMSKKTQQRFIESNRFETSLAGKKIVFQLLRTDAMDKFVRLRKYTPDEMISRQMEMAIVEVEGVGRRDIHDWIVDLDADEAQGLREAMEEVGCGIETTIEVRCVECFREQEVEIPFGRDWYSGRRKRPKKTTVVETETNEQTTGASSGSLAT